MADPIRIDNVRLSFPDLFEAVQYENDGNFKYKATFLVEPGSTADKHILAAINTVAKEAFKDKAADVLKMARSKGAQGFCYTNGGDKSYDGYEGMMALGTSRSQDKGRPGVYDRDKTPLTQQDGKPYAGCYVNAKVEFWPQDNKFGRTVRCTLISVQFAKDGDAFSAGSKPSEDDFDDLGVETEDNLL